MKRLRRRLECLRFRQLHRRGTAVVLAALAVLLCGACAARRVSPEVATWDGVVQRTGKLLAPRVTQPQSPAPPGLDLGQPLSAEDAAAVALWNNPRLRADLASLGLAEADRLDAVLVRNPRLDMLIPVGAKPFELLLQLPTETFFQRPRPLAAAQQALDQLAQSLIQNALDVARDARWAHADLAQVLARVDWAKRSLKLRERLNELTMARLRAGDISALEAVSAEAEVRAAREQVERFEHDLSIAEERLRAILGLKRGPLQIRVTPPTAQPPADLSTLLEKAMAFRPDLRAAELAVGAAAQRARWERSRVLWLAAQLSSKEVGSLGLLSGPGFNVELPLFHRNQGLIARAEAEVELASRSYLAAKQRVMLEVAEAREQLLQAQDSLKRLQQELVPTLERAVSLAQTQYQRGEAPFLLILEQTRARMDAELRIIDAEAAVRKAEAQLERSVGSK